MKRCNKCNSEFEPSKGLINFCSIICKNGRIWTEEDKIKKSEIAKNSEKVRLTNKINGNRRKKISDERIIEVISKYNTISEAARELGIKLETLVKRTKILGIYKPNPGRKGILRNNYECKVTYDEILNGEHSLRSTRLKNRLFLLGVKEKKCEECNIEDWNNKKIIFELDHIDGNHFNNNLLNLRVLCPNCHSQTITFKGKNTNGTNKKFDKEKIIELIKNGNSISKALFKLGMTPKGANFKTVYLMLEEEKLLHLIL